MSWASGIGGVIAAGVLAAGLAACGSPAATAHLPAAARTGVTAVPVRVQLNAVGWSGMTERPDHIYVGMGGAPVVRRLTWPELGRRPGLGGGPARPLLPPAWPDIRLASRPSTQSGSGCGTSWRMTASRRTARWPTSTYPARGHQGPGTSRSPCCPAGPHAGRGTRPGPGCPAGVPPGWPSRCRSQREDQASCCWPWRPAARRRRGSRRRPAPPGGRALVTRPTATRVPLSEATGRR